MARAFKCDRCESYFAFIDRQVDSDNAIYLCYSKNGMFSDVDLCPACNKELVDWFNKKKKDKDEDEILFNMEIKREENKNE